MRLHFFQQIVRAVIAGGFDGGEGTFLVASAQDGAKIVEVNVDQAGLRQQAPDAAHALRQQFVGDLQRLVDAGVFINELEDPLVRQANHAVGFGLQFAKTELRLALAASAFEFKRQGDNAEHQRARLPGEPRDDRAGARSRPAAQAGHDADDVRARAQPANGFHVFLSGPAAQFGIAARAQSARELCAKGDAFGDSRAGEGLGVRIDGRETDAGKVLPRHIINGVAG